MAVGPAGQRRTPMNKPKLPLLSILLMAVFLIGGSLILLAEWPPGPANLDWGVWIIAYFGYLYIILAALLYAKTGR
jgi:hypothetical protein